MSRMLGKKAKVESSTTLMFSKYERAVINLLKKVQVKKLDKEATKDIKVVYELLGHLRSMKYMRDTEKVK